MPGSKTDITLDIFVTTIAMVLSLPLLRLRPVFDPFAMVMTILLVLSALALLLRRRAPLTVAWITAAAAAWLTFAEAVGAHPLRDIDVNTIVWWSPGAPFAVYSVMVMSPVRRVAWLPVAVIAACSVLLAYVIDIGPVLGSPASGSQSSFALGIRGLVFVTGAALLGLSVGARRKLLQVLTERAERAERERHLLADRARADERARLAAEMHDMVTHRVSLMVMQAGALRVAAKDDDVWTAAEELRQTGCLALNELHEAVGVLRQTPGGSDLQFGWDQPDEPAVPDLSALFGESESVGCPVESIEEGEPLMASPVVSRTAFRAVQEALTNVRKHAPGARVRVTVSYRGDTVSLVVENGPPTGPLDVLLAGSGSATGLDGLRQRIDLVNGSFQAGPERDGFRLEVSLPASVSTAEG